jgi:hypothetical protein
VVYRSSGALSPAWWRWLARGADCPPPSNVYYGAPERLIGKDQFGDTPSATYGHDSGTNGIVGRTAVSISGGASTD